jgi:hypothetical protein
MIGESVPGRVIAVVGDGAGAEPDDIGGAAG